MGGSRECRRGVRSTDNSAGGRQSRLQASGSRGNKWEAIRTLDSGLKVGGSRDTRHSAFAMQLGIAAQKIYHFLVLFAVYLF